MVLLVLDALSIIAYRLALNGIEISGRPTLGAAATLILPLTGRGADPAGMIARLAAQTQPIHRLLLAVESIEDPAHASAVAAKDGAPFPVEIVVAGLSDRRSQKCTNLIAAIRRLDDDDRWIVFLDADIQLPPWWLATLLRPLVKGRADAVTGYRWHVGAGDLAGEVLTAIDRSLAVVPRWPVAKIVWGGSLALPRDVLEQIDPPTVLDRTISDDMSLGKALYDRGFRIRHPFTLHVATPVGQLKGIRLNFMLRQYRIMALHRPGLPLIAATYLICRLAAVATLLVAGTAVAFVVVATDVAASIGKFALRRRIAQRLGIPDSSEADRRQFLLALVPAAVDFCHFAVIAAAAAGRRLKWGHVVYGLEGVADTRVLTRLPHPETASGSDPPEAAAPPVVKPASPKPA